MLFLMIFSITLSYTTQPYAEAMAMRLDASYIPCDTSLREQTVNIIAFTQFEEGGLLSEICDDAKSGDKYDDDPIMQTIIREEEMDAM